MAGSPTTSPARRGEPSGAPAPESLRRWPDNWLGPAPLRAWFPGRDRIEVDLGCGKGRFLLARAAAHPASAFLGVDRMLRRIRKVDNKARRLGLDNVRLLRVEAYYAVTYLIPPAAVSVYYLFFPDPWPKKRHHAHRLFSPLFLDALHRTLVAGGMLHAATDHQPYFEEIRGLLESDGRFAAVPPFVPAEAEQTDFERYYLDRGPIGRCSFARR